MCKASIVADEFRDGTRGDKLNISMGGHGLGTFHPSGIPVESVAVCLKTGAEITMSNIPSELRGLLKVGETEPAIFIETPGDPNWIVHDLLVFPDHPDLKPIPVAGFADEGIDVVVTAVTAEDRALSGLLELAKNPVELDVDVTAFMETAGVDRGAP